MSETALPAQAAVRIHPIDVIVAGAIVATGVYWFGLTDQSWFFFDDWALAARGRTLGDFFEPYNGHLSIPYLAIYRTHMAVFGFDGYWALRTLGFLALLSVPTLVYLTTRSRWGPFPAALSAVALLWVRGVTLEPAGMNHNMTIAAGVVMAAALPRSGRRADLVVAASLAFALSASGGGVPLAVAAGVHSLLTRAPVRRWAAVLVPSALWVLWWLGHRNVGPELPEQYVLPFADQVFLVLRAQPATFRGMAAGSTVGGWLLMAFVAGWLAWRLWQAPRQAATSVVPWLAANAAWWWGLGYSRGEAATPETFRYRFVGAVLIILAMVPWDRRAADRDPEVSPTEVSPAAAPSRRWLQAAAILAATALLVVANRSETEEGADLLAGFGLAAHRVYTVAVGVPEAVPDSYQLNIAMGGLTLGQLRHLVTLYGPAWDPTGEEVDRALIDDGALVIALAPGDPGATPCEPLGEGEAPAGPRLRIRTSDEPVELRMRRFGDEHQRVVLVPADTTADITVTADLETAQTWHAVAPGACRLGP